MREQWEYKILRVQGFAAKFTDEAGASHGPFNEETLNRLGKEGWEVCAFNYSSMSAATLILKRRLGN